MACLWLPIPQHCCSLQSWLACAGQLNMACAFLCGENYVSSGHSNVAARALQSWTDQLTARFNPVRLSAPSEKECMTGLLLVEFYTRQVARSIGAQVFRGMSEHARCCLSARQDTKRAIHDARVKGRFLWQANIHSLGILAWRARSIQAGHTVIKKKAKPLLTFSSRQAVYMLHACVGRKAKASNNRA